MALTKVQAEGINLADTFAYTGTVTGTQGLVKLSSTAISTAVTAVAFTNVDTTYDFYQVNFFCTPASNNVNFFARFKDSGGSDLTGSIYGGGAVTEGGGTDDESNGTTSLLIASSQGNASGESCSGTIIFGPVTGVTDVSPCGFFGFYTGANENGNHQSRIISRGIIPGQNQVIRGITFKFNTGNISNGTFTLYGIVK